MQSRKPPRAATRVRSSEGALTCSGSLMFESAVMCASNHEFGADCQPVTGSRRRENKSEQGTILPVRPHRMDRITVRVGSLLPSAERVTAICIEPRLSEPRLSEAFHDDGYVNHGFRNDDRDEYLSPRALWLCSARNRRVDQISALLILPSWLGAPRTPALL